MSHQEDGRKAKPMAEAPMTNMTAAAQYEGFVCIGLTALRDPKTGNYLPAVPLYIREEDGARESQEALIKDVGRLFADRIRRYQDECKAAGVPV